MSKRRKRGMGADVIRLPWQFSAVLAVGGFAAMRWILPGLMPPTPTLAALSLLFEPLSWIVLVMFGVFAVMAALRARLHRTAADHGVSQSRIKPAVPPALNAQSVPATWSLAALRRLEWKRFELLCARYYEAVGFRTETLDAGPDGGIDVKLFKTDPSVPLAVVQCKAWNTRQVGVKEIRELLGVMVHAKVARGIFITTGSYSDDAIAFGAANPIQLLDGAAFDQKIRALSQEWQDELLGFAFAGDYLTPTCPSCGVKMLARDSKRGPFWGCVHYPRCKSMFPMKA